MRVIPLAGAAAALALVLAPAAGAGATRISDVRGDANGTDRRGEGVQGADDVQAGPASVDAVDVVGAELGVGRLVVHLAGQSAPVPLERLFTVTLTTSRCATVTLTWASDGDGTRLHGCHWIQDLWLRDATQTGNDLVLPLPTSWPRWLPAGTAVSRITVQSHGMLEIGVPGSIGFAGLYVGGDYATGSVSTTLR